MKIDETFVVNVMQRMVQIESTNPSLHAAGVGEAEVADYVASVMAGLGVTVRRFEPEAGRVSVVGTWPGSSGGRSLMLNAHLDTVDVDGMAEPFSGAVREGRLYGRGSQDMKGAMAAQLGALKAIIDAGVSLKGDVYVAGVADEECASIGVQSILPHYQPDGVVVTEPSDLEISIAHKGFVWIEVKTFGKAYHGSRPDLGVDANMAMGRFLAELAGLERELAGRPQHRLVGPPSLHAATLQGGSGWSTYAAECTLGIERRTIPGETAAQVEAEIQGLIDRLKAADPELQIEMRIELVRDWFEVDEAADIVTAAKEATTKVLGTESPIIGQAFWTDAAFHGHSGSETILIGPTGHGLHSEEEWVEVDSVVQLAEILADMMVRYCEVD